MSTNPPRPTRLVKRLELGFEEVMFACRWLILPCYVGLLVALGMVSVKFVQELLHAIPLLLTMNDSGLVLILLTLIDLSLAGNLLLMVVFAGYENFVSKIDTQDHEDRPEWLGKIDFSGIKLKLLSSIIAISAIHLLQTFMSIDTVSDDKIRWQLLIFGAFVLSGVLLALMDWLTSLKHGREE